MWRLIILLIAGWFLLPYIGMLNEFFANIFRITQQLKYFGPILLLLLGVWNSKYFQPNGDTVAGRALKSFFKAQHPHNNVTPNAAKMNKSYSTKRSVNGYTKKWVGASQSWACAHCRQMLPPSYHVDHVIPLCRGGSNQLNNLVALCPTCHANKTFKDAMGVY